ncbi:ATP-binding protein [Desulforhabdus sp. TSK]|uniref:ATP-binding protein n=1 Tax=Desulforhabdus sp. TSK TaxID=2925014 RepID=UPI001FC7E4F6|nr:hypothetical protein [Desulforhabdus sp. TSK]GKT09140.1 hypothetical protein DSTSK_24450 [Desulforhabdus sp. TSK]
MAVSVEHNLFPDLPPRAELFEKVGLLEKSWLDGTFLGFPGHIGTILREFQFFRITGSPAVFDEKNSRLLAKTALYGFFPAIHNQSLPVIYIIRGNREGVQLYMGTNAMGPASFSALFAGHLNPSLYAVAPEVSGWDLQSYRHGVALTGIPHLHREREQDREGPAGFQAPLHFDRMLLGLLREEWIYIVQAFPLMRQQTNGWFEQCAREVKDTKESFLLRDSQKPNRTASYYVEILERSIQRLKRGKQQGLWQTGVYLLCANPETARRGAALLCSIHAGERSIPEPVRCHICRQDATLSPFLNCYHSEELQAFITLPGREFPGYRLQEQPVFDVDFTSGAEKPVAMGSIIDHGAVLSHRCSIPADDLTMHGLVAGVTGSGKTSTILHLLLDLHRRYHVPFLVIEPAKSEYRRLMREIDSLLVFTLGEERPGVSAPFRLNPFAFPPGISLQTHIDYLKAVFSASFVMYAPMPYVLDECLYRIYEDRGWNLVTSTNPRGCDGAAFPTLMDLYRKIDEVVDGLGYQDRTTMDIKAALKTRIRNLCLGGKGMMLNTVSSVPFGDLMTRPVVLELKYLGNDEEKAFMMGLILMALSEHWEAAQSRETAAVSGLRHLTVIEEAHRLLRNAPSEKASEEQSNIRGKGVETFCNLLAEIRAYGEGVIVSEQIPSKLAPDVIKNSNLKIMHRMVSKEDRDMMGDTMNLDSLQKRQVLSLGAGEAIFFREGLDRPMRILVPLPEVKSRVELLNDSDVRTGMITRYYRERPYLLQEKAACSVCPASNVEECEQVKREVRKLCSREGFEELLVRCFLPYLLQPDRRELREHFTAVLGSRQDFEGGRFHCLASELIRRYLGAKGDFLSWSFETIGRLTAEAEESIASREAGRIIGLHCLREGAKGEGQASPVCDQCRVRCLFAYEGKVIGKDPLLHNRLVQLLSGAEHGLRFYQDLVILLLDHLRDILAVEEGRHVTDLAFCCLVNKLVELGFSVRTQRSILERFVQVASSVI